MRDLEWIVTAPFMLAKDPEPDLSNLPETKRLLFDLQQDPSPLLSHLESLNRHTLGSYFEHLVIFWLSQLPTVSILATNLQIFDGKTTLGEFDLLFMYQNKCYHWELAIKFYLNIGSGTSEVDYVGPRLRDNLERKLTRLYDHQLQLSNREEAKAKLQQMGAKKIHSYAWVKGVLFQSGIADKDPPKPFPNRVSQNCPTGKWIRMSELEEASRPDIEFFLLPQKPNWLSSHYYQSEVFAGGMKALAAKTRSIMSKEQSPILAYLLSPGQQQSLEVSERLFIVGDDWAR